VVLFLFSCEKGVTFELAEPVSKLVVEATIENDQSPVVILSKSLNYFSSISPDILANSFVRNAEIYISNDNFTHKLKEYSQPLGNGYTFYYYSIDSANLATAFTGKLNTRYELRIVWEGKEYNASTKIPLITKRIDSLFWRQAPGNSPANKIVLMVKATDPPGYGDYIRYFTKRNSEPFYPAVNSVFDDQIIDGTTYEVEVERGVDRSLDLKEGFTFFDKGDTVVFKLCNIEKPVFEFWRTMEFSYSSVGNPFSSPTKVLGNISNGALGYFGGYAAQFRSIIIPR
jgi:hypothetical protein